MLFVAARKRSFQRRTAQIEALNFKAQELRADMGLEDTSFLRVESNGQYGRVMLAPFLEGLQSGVFVTSENLYTRLHDTAHLGHVWQAGPGIVDLAIAKAGVGSRLLQDGQRRRAGRVGRGLDLMLSQALSTEVVSSLLAYGDHIDTPTPADLIPDQSIQIIAEQRQFLTDLHEAAKTRAIGRQAFA